MTRRRGKRGLSLTELVVAAALFSLFLGTLLAFLRFGRRSVEHGAMRTDGVRSNAFALETLVEELGSATRILLPAEGRHGSCLAYEDGAGMTRLVYLSQSREHVLLRVVGHERGRIVADTRGTPLLFSRLRFSNEGREGIVVAISLATRRRLGGLGNGPRVAATLPTMLTRVALPAL